MTISASARRQIDSLSVAQPEAAPWLGVLRLALAELNDRVWDAAVAATAPAAARGMGAPLLAGATVALDRGMAAHWVQRVVAAGSDAGPNGATLRQAAWGPGCDPLALLAAAVNADDAALAAVARDLDADSDALAAIAVLAAMPLLHALRRRFAGAADPGWSHGWCPVCGGWPALAEQRGLERTRRLRCARCGGDWAQLGIRCPYCDVTGHAARGSLVIAGDGGARLVETCGACRGYLKSVATLRAWAGDEIALADLATVELDLAALERDFTRPAARPLSPPIVAVTGA